MPGQQLELHRLQNAPLQGNESIARTSLLRNVTRQPGHLGAPGPSHGSAPRVPAKIGQSADVSVGQYAEPN